MFVKYNRLKQVCFEKIFVIAKKEMRIFIIAKKVANSNKIKKDNKSFLLISHAKSRIKILIQKNKY